MITSPGLVSNDDVNIPILKYKTFEAVGTTDDIIFPKYNTNYGTLYVACEIHRNCDRSKGWTVPYCVCLNQMLQWYKKQLLLELECSGSPPGCRFFFRLFGGLYFFSHHYWKLINVFWRNFKGRFKTTQRAIAQNDHSDLKSIFQYESWIVFV